MMIERNALFILYFSGGLLTAVLAGEAGVAPWVTVLVGCVMSTGAAKMVCP